MDYRTLGNTGLSVSTLSFGASSLGGAFRDVDEAEAQRAVHVALDGGVNYVDVSPYYGATKAEAVLGRALQGVARDRYVLSTKVGQYGTGEFDFSAARTRKSIDESLARLGCEHIDLILCHDIEFADLDQIVSETLPTLHEIKKTGKVRHVGITGLPLKVFPAVIERVPAGTVEAILSFCRCELNDDSLLSLVPDLKRRGIGIVNAAPTGMGLLTTRGAPDWHPASETIKAGCKRAVELCQRNGWDIVEIAIGYCLTHPDIATTLVGTASPTNMAANLKYANTPVDAGKQAAVLEVLKPIHNFNFTRGRPENRDEIVG